MSDPSVPATDDLVARIDSLPDEAKAQVAATVAALERVPDPPLTADEVVEKYNGLDDEGKQRVTEQLNRMQMRSTMRAERMERSEMRGKAPS